MAEPHSAFSVLGVALGTRFVIPARCRSADSHVRFLSYSLGLALSAAISASSALTRR